MSQIYYIKYKYKAQQHLAHKSLKILEKLENFKTLAKFLKLARTLQNSCELYKTRANFAKLLRTLQNSREFLKLLRTLQNSRDFYLSTTSSSRSSYFDQNHHFWTRNTI